MKRNFLKFQKVVQRDNLANGRDINYGLDYRLSIEIPWKQTKVSLKTL